MRKESVYAVFDHETDREIGRYASWTRDTPAKMRDYLVRHGSIPNDAYVRSVEELAALNVTHRTRP